MLDMPVFGQVPGGDVVHLNRHKLIHRLALLEIWIELFTELTPSAGLRVVDLSSYRGSIEIHVGEFLLHWISDSIRLGLEAGQLNLGRLRAL
jgi:hypothetical protein